MAQEKLSLGKSFNQNTLGNITRAFISDEFAP